jgi:hypothetical protein
VIGAGASAGLADRLVWLNKDYTEREPGACLAAVVRGADRRALAPGKRIATGERLTRPAALRRSMRAARAPVALFAFKRLV